MAHDRNRTDATTDASPMLTIASNDIFAHAMSNSGVLNTNSMMEQVTKTCQFAHTLFKETFNFRKIQKELLQAVADGDTNAICNILREHHKIESELLLLDPQYSFTITSKLTFQTFYAENPLKMAAKRKQLNMIDFLLKNYYEKLEPTKVVDDAIAESLSAWKCYEMKKDVNGIDQIIIPKEYITYFESLVEVISKETFPYGRLSKDNNKLSEETELKLSELLDRLIPKQAVKLDDYLDVELFLLAAYTVYRDENVLNDDKKWDAFCIRVIGLILSVLSPEPSEIWCEGLDKVVVAITANKEIKISENAHNHKLKDGSPFYRSSRDSREGQGFDFLTDIVGGRVLYELDGRSAALRWTNYVKQKQQIFGKLCSKYSLSTVEADSMKISNSRAG